jgi:hypothetical protein
MENKKAIFQPINITLKVKIFGLRRTAKRQMPKQLFLRPTKSVPWSRGEFFVVKSWLARETCLMNPQAGS